VNSERATYHDGCFYNDTIDLDYYFYDRLGLAKPDRFKDKGDNVNMGVTTNEGDLNTSRILKVNTEPTKDNGEVLTLVENKTDIETPKAKSEEVLQNDNYVDETRRKSTISAMSNVKTALTEYKGVTYNDYHMVPGSLVIEYDIRNSLQYFKEEVIRNHSVIKLITKHSYIDPRGFSLLKLYYRFNLIFAFNAFTLTDLLIEQRANSISRVNYSNIRKVYSILY
jgi:hypothetical protein